MLIKWTKKRKKSKQTIFYESFNEKQELNNILRREQKYICCYCQQIIDHYQGDNIAGSHNEHLQPQNHPNVSKELQVSYFNIYACCNYSVNQSEKFQHCGESKGNLIISNLIQRRNCRRLLKYNLLGEILPVGPFRTIEEYNCNTESLTDLQVQVLADIFILNLNLESLKNERIKDITGIHNSVKSSTKKQIKQIINKISLNHNLLDLLICSCFF